MTIGQARGIMTISPQKGSVWRQYGVSQVRLRLPAGVGDLKIALFPIHGCFANFKSENHAENMNFPVFGSNPGCARHLPIEGPDFELRTLVR